MTLISKRIAIDQDSSVIKYKRSFLHPDCAFLDPNRYFHQVHDSFDDMFKSLTSRTLEPVEEYLTHTNMSHKDLMTLWMPSSDMTRQVVKQKPVHPLTRMCLCR